MRYRRLGRAGLQVSELLLGSDEWTSSLFAPYAEERTERMRRLRFCAEVDSIVHVEFGEGPQRRRMAIRERRAKDPAFMMQSAAVMIGPEMLPGELFSDSAKAEIMAMGGN